MNQHSDASIALMPRTVVVVPTGRSNFQAECTVYRSLACSYEVDESVLLGQRQSKPLCQDG